MLLVLDLLGTFVFAVEGAMAAAGGSFDAFGVLVLSFATALGGGIIRDILLGSLPVAAIKHWLYPAVAFSGGLLVFFLHAFVLAVPAWIIVATDALGLSLCCVAGARKSLEYGVHQTTAVLIAAINGVGGGTIRDMLMARSPNVLHSDIYAVAAIFGATVMLVSQRLGLKPSFAAVLGASACFVLRLVSVWQDWNLPRLA